KGEVRHHQYVQQRGAPRRGQQQQQQQQQQKRFEMEKKRSAVLQFEELKDEAWKLRVERKEFEDRGGLQAVAAHAAEVARVTEESPVAMPPQMWCQNRYYL
ncbi:unnamed protein product, partial [Pylaiella littoralis]